MGDNDFGFHHSRAVDKGIVTGADASAGIGRAPDPMKGVLGKPIVSNGMTTAVKRSDNSEMGLARKLNEANAAAQRRGPGR
jgi:hypothetical protein